MKPSIDLSGQSAYFGENLPFMQNLRCGWDETFVQQYTVKD